MTALILDERCFVLASYVFFLLMKTEQVISGTSAATYKVTEPNKLCILQMQETLGREDKEKLLKAARIGQGLLGFLKNSQIVTQYN